jgi:hypothetical protein
MAAPPSGRTDRPSVIAPLSVVGVEKTPITVLVRSSPKLNGHIRAVKAGELRPDFPDLL